MPSCPIRRPSRRVGVTVNLYMEITFEYETSRWSYPIIQENRSIPHKEGMVPTHTKLAKTAKNLGTTIKQKKYKKYINTHTHTKTHKKSVKIYKKH